MKRYIEVEAVKERLKGSPIFNHFGEDGLFIREAVLDIIDKFATDHSADVLEVVRCRDCKYYQEYEPPLDDFDGWCPIHENDYDRAFYCQYGERREENEG